MNKSFRLVACIYLALIVVACICAINTWFGCLPIILAIAACIGLVHLGCVWTSTLPDYFDNRNESEKRDRSHWISN